MATEIIIRKAELKDSIGIYTIDQFWYQKYIQGDYSQGYLYLQNNYTLSNIEKIVTESEATVAVEGDKVISYYFINPFFETGNIAQRKKIIQNKIEEGFLPNGKYAYSLQAATDENYTGRGINRDTLNLLKSIAKDKYDYLIGVMSYENNTTHKSSLKMGWKHFGDIGIGILAIIGTTNETNNQLKF